MGSCQPQSPRQQRDGRDLLGRELAAKRLGLLHELMPTATIMALLVNPTNPALAETTTSNVQAAARILGLELHILNAGTEHNSETVFETLVKLRQARSLSPVIDLHVRREKFAALALRHGMLQCTDIRSSLRPEA